MYYLNTVDPPQAEIQMILRGINFGRVFCASGARNFYGDGWGFHKLFERFGLDYRGSTLITKTTTLLPRLGNLPLKGTKPRELMPSCIVAKPLKKVVLNAVGLSGPGLPWLLKQGEWQKRTDPFFISLMAVSHTPKEKAEEMREMRLLLQQALPEFRAKVALQLNVSCPNLGQEQERQSTIEAMVDELEPLNIPIVVKINACFTAFAMEGLLRSRRHVIDGVSVSNTIPWTQFPTHLQLRYFGTNTSPLAHLGGGGVSGEPLLPFTRAWIEQARDSFGITQPIMAGGGILSAEDARELLRVGADAIELGSVSILRPWRIRNIIREANAMSIVRESRGVVSA